MLQRTRHQLGRAGLAAALVAAAALGLALAWGAAAPAGYSAAPPFTRVRELPGFSQNSVRVALALERDRNGALVIAGTFTPEEPDSHVYSTDLPRGGIDGAGRPTLLELAPQGALRPLGPARADQAAVLQQFEGFSRPFPVYPDGPVTLRLPVALASGGGPAQAELLISYMACSSKGYCMPPVSAKSVDITVVDSELR